jgi:hypothetical protein
MTVEHYERISLSMMADEFLGIGRCGLLTESQVQMHTLWSSLAVTRKRLSGDHATSFIPAEWPT